MRSTQAAARGASVNRANIRLSVVACHFSAERPPACHGRKAAINLTLRVREAATSGQGAEFCRTPLGDISYPRSPKASTSHCSGHPRA